MDNVAGATADHHGQTFGEKVRDIRKQMGITQGHLAQSAEITQGHLSNIEAGNTTPSAGVILKLAQAMCSGHRELRELLDAAGYGDMLGVNLKVSPALIRRLEQLTPEQQRRLTIFLDGFDGGEEA